MSEEIINILNLTAGYKAKNKQVLKILEVNNFLLKAGAKKVLIGPSGSGKTTFLNIISGLFRPLKGKVYVNGVDIYNISESKRDALRASDIGYVFQDFNLVPSLSILDNITLSMSFSNRIKASEQKEEAKRVLEEVGLAHRFKHKPMQLSVGERQRVAVARAISNRPSILLADEPTGNLDNKNAGMVIRKMKELCEEYGSSMIIVTHDQNVAGEFEDIIKIEGGVLA